MLNQDSLAQLKGLKSQMESEKEHADAIVKGTHDAAVARGLYAKYIGS